MGEPLPPELRWPPRPDRPAGPPRRLEAAIDHVIAGLGRHWLLVFNVVSGLAGVRLVYPYFDRHHPCVGAPAREKPAAPPARRTITAAGDAGSLPGTGSP